MNVQKYSYIDSDEREGERDRGRESETQGGGVGQSEREGGKRANNCCRIIPREITFNRNLEIRIGNISIQYHNSSI